MTNQNFTLLTSAEYWQELETQYAHLGAGDRVAMMVMSFDPAEPITARVSQALIAAAGRGAEVHLVVDAYNFLIHLHNDTPGPLWWHAKTSRTWRSYRVISEGLDELRRTANVHVSVINMPARSFTNPKSGRSHIKFTVINDRVFVGGCNLNSTTWLDGMLTWQDRPTATYLFELVQALEHTPSTKTVLAGKDRRIALDNRTDLLIDAGKKGQSTILEEALQLIDNAEKFVVITCQYFPNSVTARHLQAAHARGVKVQIVYGNPQQQGPVGQFIQYGSNARERLHTPRELFQYRLPKTGAGIHAKIIATDKGAMIGSHNYVYAGVMFGTAEMAVLRHDAAFGEQMVDLVDRLLASAPFSVKK